LTFPEWIIQSWLEHFAKNLLNNASLKLIFLLKLAGFIDANSYVKPNLNSFELAETGRKKSIVQRYEATTQSTFYFFEKYLNFW